MPVAFLGRTSTLTMQDPVASMRRQVREVQAKLPAGLVHRRLLLGHRVRRRWTSTHRGHGTAHEQFPDIGIPRDGGLADLLAEAALTRPPVRRRHVRGHRTVRPGHVQRAASWKRSCPPPGCPLFATDEPIDVAGMNATTVLVRRVKQGVAEWYRLQIKEKAWKGLREHALAGWNIGTPPYGYTAQRVPHPVPVKAAQGAHQDPPCPGPRAAAAVAQIFTWRTEEQARDGRHHRPAERRPRRLPAAQGRHLDRHGVYALLGNPKYTGYMVWNRSTKHNGGRRHPNPPAEWIWSPSPPIRRSSPATCTTPRRPSAAPAPPPPGNQASPPTPGPPHL